MPRSLADLTWPSRTERLTLRPATAADAAAVWAYRRLPEVAEWMTSAATTQEEFAARFVAPDVLPHVLVAERDGVVVADLKIEVADAWTQAEVREHGRGQQAEIGWAVDPAHQGQGLATEAARELLRLCFHQMHLHRVEAFCFAANTPSWRVMDKLGMRREAHTLADGYHRSRGWLDGYGYAMLGSEWREQTSPARDQTTRDRAPHTARAT